MQINFLESNFLSDQNVLIFGITRLQSQPTFRQIKSIHAHYDRLKGLGFDEVYCLTFSDFPLFEPLVCRLSSKIQFVQDTNINSYKKLLNKFGNNKFLTEQWQFVFSMKNKTVDLFLQQTFDSQSRDPDTGRNIYSEVSPEKVLETMRD